MKHKTNLKNKKGIALCALLSFAALACWLFAAVKTKKKPQRFFVLVIAPLIAVLLPFAVIAAVAASAYYVNGVYKKIRTARPFSFKLNKIKLSVFTASLLFLLALFCLALLPSAALFALLPACLSFALALGFWRSFAVKNKDTADFKPEIELLNCKINSVTPKQTIEKIADYLFSARQSLFHVLTADALSLIRVSRDKGFKTLFEKANLRVPDGMGILWASDFINAPLRARVAGVELVSELCAESVQNNFKLFFVGAKPGIACKAVERLKQKYNINVCGVEHGYFEANSPNEQAVIEKIKLSGPDIIFVAMGVPKQEYFINKLRENNVKAVAIGVGGSLDVISETLKRSPELMQKCGLEWLYRLWLEPKRYKKMLDLPVFVFKVFSQA